MDTTEASRLGCVIVTPEKTVLETDADFVALPLFDGEVGIGLLHSPMIGRLGFGEMRIRNGEATERYYVDGGFVQVADNQVAVLTNRAVPAGEVDRTAAQEQLDASLRQKTAGVDELAIRDRQIAQARGQLRVAARV